MLVNGPIDRINELLRTGAVPPLPTYICTASTASTGSIGCWQRAREACTGLLPPSPRPSLPDPVLLLLLLCCRYAHTERKA